MSYDTQIKSPTIVHDCPNCGGHDTEEEDN